jgi:hypothetical protein
VRGGAIVCGSFGAPGGAGRWMRTEAGRKKSQEIFRTGVDRTAAVLLKSQPAPQTVDDAGGGANLLCEIRSFRRRTGRVQKTDRRGCGRIGSL